VPDDSQQGGDDNGLSQAVTSLPPEVQMLGYRLMWGLAGLISLGGAAVSWFMREDEDLSEAGPGADRFPGGVGRRVPSPQRTPVGVSAVVPHTRR
jgi:hypothetical protein